MLSFSSSAENVERSSLENLHECCMKLAAYQGEHVTIVMKCFCRRAIWFCIRKHARALFENAKSVQSSSSTVTHCTNTSETAWAQRHNVFVAFDFIGSDPQNGGFPVNSSNIRIPSDQRSAERSWPLLRMISGATYSGVPQNVHVFRLGPIFFAKPKST